MKVLVYSAKDFEIPYLEKANQNSHEITYIKAALNSDTAMQAVGYKAISIFSADEANLITLEKLKEFGVKYIALRSVGFDNVNLRAATRLGILVANVPAYSPYAIAEHAMALLLALNRKIVDSHARIQQYNFNLNGLVGYDMHKKSVGIIGTGRIGAVMAKILHGFGCRLLANDIVENDTLKSQYGLEYTSLEDVCKRADIITIHVPLNADTHKLINEELVSQMKPGIIIINTARGAVIDTEAVLKGMEDGTIAALGMDVYENEKDIFFKDRSDAIPTDELFMKLNAYPNVLITGHHAFLTKEALSNIAETTIYNLDQWAEDKVTENALNSMSE